MKQFLSLLLSFGFLISSAQESPNLKFYPPNWWTEMPEEEFQLMIFGINKNWEVSIPENSEITIVDKHYVDNPRYVFLDIDIPAGFEGSSIPLSFDDGDVSMKMSYPLLQRDNQPNIHRGVNSSDLIYLIFPDRFANGNEQNDIDLGMTDKRVLRDSLKARHGGDIQGIRDNLSHFKDLGATALWVNPLLTNDEPWESYHGYAATDHYEIDPRFGTLEEYKALVDECHRSGIKVIIDIVFNHVGDNHHLIKNLPSKDWIHIWDEFQKTSYRAPTLMDPYASEADKKIMTDGWFDSHMPDLNQKNELLANFLITNSIWWVEMTGIDAYRIDTYAYSDEEFMVKWAKKIKQYYPKFTFFGETWVHGSPIQAHFTQNNNMHGDFNTELPGVTDFQLYYAINDALTKPQGWTDGMAKLYYTMAKDFVYEDPNRNVLFLDNHDLGRFYSMVGEDFEKWKMGIGWLMTTRGIPMMYYGTEILMTGYTDPDAKVRADYPGGWSSDAVNKFTKEGRTDQENEAYNYIKKLASFRKKSRAITAGKTMQFVPIDGVYVYFRYNDSETVMVVMNSSDKEMALDMNRYAERTGSFSKGLNVVTDAEVELEDLKIGSKGLLILQLK
ncbi:MAG: alpha-amylase family glycosyl hydrolase [Flavobacteriales bacterium]